MFNYFKDVYFKDEFIEPNSNIYISCIEYLKMIQMIVETYNSLFWKYG